jgi:hypothetical protein
MPFAVGNLVGAFRRRLHSYRRRNLGGRANTTVTITERASTPVSSPRRRTSNEAYSGTMLGHAYEVIIPTIDGQHEVVIGPSWTRGLAIHPVGRSPRPSNCADSIDFSFSDRRYCHRIRIRRIQVRAWTPRRVPNLLFRRSHGAFPSIAWQPIVLLRRRSS